MQLQINYSTAKHIIKTFKKELNNLSLPVNTSYCTYQAKKEIKPQEEKPRTEKYIGKITTPAKTLDNST